MKRLIGSFGVVYEIRREDDMHIISDKDELIGLIMTEIFDAVLSGYTKGDLEIYDENADATYVGDWELT